MYKTSAVLLLFLLTSCAVNDAPVISIDPVLSLEERASFDQENLNKLEIILDSGSEYCGNSNNILVPKSEVTDNINHVLETNGYPLVIRALMNRYPDYVHFVNCFENEGRYAHLPDDALIVENVAPGNTSCIDFLLQQLEILRVHR